METRVGVYGRLCKLQGRLNLVLSQVGAVKITGSVNEKLIGLLMTASLNLISLSKTPYERENIKAFIVCKAVRVYMTHNIRNQLSEKFFEKLTLLLYAIYESKATEDKKWRSKQ